MSIKPKVGNRVIPIHDLDIFSEKNVGIVSSVGETGDFTVDFDYVVDHERSGEMGVQVVGIDEFWRFATDEDGDGVTKWNIADAIRLGYIKGVWAHETGNMVLVNCNDPCNENETNEIGIIIKLDDGSFQYEDDNGSFTTKSKTELGLRQLRKALEELFEVGWNDWSPEMGVDFTRH